MDKISFVHCRKYEYQDGYITMEYSWNSSEKAYGAVVYRPGKLHITVLQSSSSTKQSHLVQVRAMCRSLAIKIHEQDSQSSRCELPRYIRMDRFNDNNRMDKGRPSTMEDICG